jgi:hypothetical protein
VQSRQLGRQVCFKDCHVGDVFGIDKDSPYMRRSRSRLVVDNLYDLEPSDILKAKVISVEEEDSTICIDVYVNNEEYPRVSGWLYSWIYNSETPLHGSDLWIENNLRFLSKRKNNYW